MSSRVRPDLNSLLHISRLPSTLCLLMGLNLYLTEYYLVNLFWCLCLSLYVSVWLYPTKSFARSFIEQHRKQHEWKEWGMLCRIFNEYQGIKSLTPTDQITKSITNLIVYQAITINIMLNILILGDCFTIMYLLLSVNDTYTLFWPGLQKST